jgi:hypothetical protein
MRLRDDAHVAEEGFRAGAERERRSGARGRGRGGDGLEDERRAGVGAGDGGEGGVELRVLGGGRDDAARARLEAAAVAFSDDELTAMVAEELARIETVLAGEPENCRRGLDALPAGRRLRIEELVIEMRQAFDGGPEERRGAFRALLGDRRIRVLEDAERGFRVEGKQADARGPITACSVNPSRGGRAARGVITRGGWGPDHGAISNSPVPIV